MAVVYFDASALVKLVIDEAGSDLAAALWDSCDAAVTSRLSYPEVRAALSALGRNHALTPAALQRAVTDWEEFWASTRPVELTASVAKLAGDVSDTHGLRGADGVHLASALTLGESSVIVAVWDRRLHTSARAAGLRVAPASLDD